MHTHSAFWKASVKLCLLFSDFKLNQSKLSG